MVNVKQGLTQDQIITELVDRQRQRSTAMRLRIRVENGITAAVAHTEEVGYYAGLKPAERKKCWSKAKKLVKKIVKQIKHNQKFLTKGQPEKMVDIDFDWTGMIDASYRAIDAYNKEIDRLGNEMEAYAAQLPIAKWCDKVKHPERRGFGLLSLAQILGECGNPSNYATKGKIKKRLGLAPWQKGEQTLAGATWKSGREGSLSKEEWRLFGYCPRRRSVSYVIGNNMKMQNGRGATKGPYRQLYEDTKKKARKAHRDWPKGRVDFHANRVVASAILVDLWQEWPRGQSLQRGVETVRLLSAPPLGQLRDR